MRNPGVTFERPSQDSLVMRLILYAWAMFDIGCLAAAWASGVQEDVADWLMKVIVNRTSAAAALIRFNVCGPWRNTCMGNDPALSSMT